MKLRIARKIRSRCDAILAAHMTVNPDGSVSLRAPERHLRRAYTLTQRLQARAIMDRWRRRFLLATMPGREAWLARRGFEPVAEGQRKMNRLNWELYGRP